MERPKSLDKLDELKVWWNADFKSIIKSALFLSSDRSEQWKLGFEEGLKSFALAFGLDQDDTILNLQPHFIEEIWNQLKATAELRDLKEKPSGEYDKGMVKALTYIAQRTGTPLEGVFVANANEKQLPPGRICN